MRNNLRTPVFAKKSLGQNFLVDEDVVEKIVTAFGAEPGDLVLEIGPGRGALTKILLDRGPSLLAMEFDDHLTDLLRERFAAYKNFTLIKADALNFDFASLSKEGRKIRLIANLPYNISTAILQRLFDHADVFSDCVLMFQREVAERITAVADTSDRGYLSVLTEAYFDVERLFDVPPNAFRPEPKVWSSVVRLRPTNRPVENVAAFRKLLAAAFAQKRKTILNNLKHVYPSAPGILESAGINGKRRAETLLLEEWVRLTALLA